MAVTTLYREIGTTDYFSTRSQCADQLRIERLKAAHAELRQSLIAFGSSDIPQLRDAAAYAIDRLDDWHADEIAGGVVGVFDRAREEA